VLYAKAGSRKAELTSPVTALVAGAKATYEGPIRLVNECIGDFPLTDMTGHMVLHSDCRPAGTGTARSNAAQIAGEADTNAQQDQISQIEFESLE
jgi:hypothetical protein